MKLNDACRYGLDNGCTTVGEAVAAVQRDACKLFTSEMEKEEIWISEYANDMPLLRYTLKKDGKSYYLVEVEQINY